MADNNAPKKRIKTADTTFDIVEHIHKHGSSSLSDIASDVELAKSTAHAHLETLMTRGYIVKNDGEYQIGLRFLDLGHKARQNIEVFKVVKPRMERLAEEIGERTQFMIEEQGRGVYIYRASSPQAVPTDASVGKYRYLHACSSGKAILAHYSQERVDQIIDSWGLPAVTENTITDPDELMEELSTIRQRGYATNKGESIESLWALGTAITDAEGEIIGALSVGGPGHRMRKANRFEEELPNELLGTVEEIELNIPYL